MNIEPVNSGERRTEGGERARTTVAHLFGMAIMALLLWTLAVSEAQVTTGPNRGGSVSSTTATIAFTNQNVLYVRTNGNDGTARIGRIDLPWASLTNAFTNLVDGCVVDVGPGTWNCGISNQLSMPTNGVLRGAGSWATTLIASNWNDGATYVGAFLKISDNCQIENLRISIPYEADMYLTPIGTDINSGSATNATVRDVQIYGNSDGLMLSSSNRSELTAWNTAIWHAYDGINMQHNSNSIIRLFNCAISEYEDAARANWAGGGVGEGVGCQKGDVYMYGGSIWATNRLGVNLNDAADAFVYLEGVTITTTNFHLYSVITSGTTPNFIAKNVTTGTAEQLRIAGKVWMDNGNALNTVDTPLYGKNLTNSGVSSLKNRVIYGYDTNRLILSSTNTVLQTPGFMVDGANGAGSAIYGSSNLVEFVDANTNKVFQVGTNGNTYLGGPLFFTGSPKSIGANGSSQSPDTIFWAGGNNLDANGLNLGASKLIWFNGGTYINSAADTQLALMGLGSAFDRLQFGGTTVTFPAWKRTLAGFTLTGADGTANSTNSLIVPGTVTATNGVVTYTTAATNTVAATGWTNTFGVNAKVRITGTAVAVTIKAADESVLDSYTLGTADTVVELLQPLQAITAASGLVGTAKPF